MERLAFLMEMIDKVTGPSKMASRALGGLKSAFSKVKETTSKAATAVTTTAKSWGSSIWAKASKGISTVQGTLQGLALGGALKDLGVGAGELVVAGTKMVLDAITFKQATTSAFTAMEGSEKAGKALYDHILEMSLYFRKSPKDMMSSVMSLRAAGLETNQALSLLQTTMDLSAFKPGADIKSLVTQLGQAKSKGKLMTEEMMVLAESGGLATGKIKEALVDVLKLGEVNPKNLDKVQQFLSGGKITADQGIEAVQKAVMSLTGTKKAGEYAEKARNSVAGLIEGLKSAPEQFMLRMSVDDGPIKKLLLMLNDLFDPTKESGKQFLKVMNEVGNTLATMLGDAAKPENMEKLKEVLLKLINAAPKLIKLFFIMFETLMFLTDVCLSFGDNVEYVKKEIVAWWEENGTVVKTLKIIAGIVGGVLAIALTSMLVLVGSLVIAFTILAVVIGASLLVVFLALAAAILLCFLPFILIAAAVYAVWKGFEWVWEKIKGFAEFLGGLVKGMFGIGAAILGGIWDGMKSVASGLESFVNGVGDTIKSALGFDTGPKKDSVFLKNMSDVASGAIFSGENGFAPERPSRGVAPPVKPVSRASMSSNVSRSVGDINLSIPAISADPKQAATDIAGEVRKQIVLALRESGDEMGAPNE